MSTSLPTLLPALDLAAASLDLAASIRRSLARTVLPWPATGRFTR